MPIDIPKVDEVTTSSKESRTYKSERLLSTIEIKAKETFISFRDKIEKMFSKESSEEKDTSSHDSKISTLETTSEDRGEVDTILIENEDLDDGDEEVDDGGEYWDDEVDDEDYWDDDESEEDSEEEEEDGEDYWDEEDEDPDEEVDDEEDERVETIWSGGSDLSSTSGIGKDLEGAISDIETDSESYSEDNPWSIGDTDGMKVDTITTEDSEEVGGKDPEKTPYEKRLEELGFPESVDEIEATTYLGGSSDVMAGFVGGDPKASKMFVVKKARADVDEWGYSSLNTGQLVEGHIADRIYEALGFNVPKSAIYDGGSHKVAEFIPGKDLCAIEESDYREKIAEEVRKGFVLDCLLGNSNVIGGLGGDNIRVGLDGKVYRIDNDGSLRYGARGEFKENFGSRVTELETMREENSIFSTITDSEIFAQIEYLIDNKDKIFETFDAVLDELGIYNYWGLRPVLIQRLVYLDKYPAIKSYMDSLKGYFEEFYRNEGIPDETKAVIRKNIEEAVENNWDTYVKAAKNNHLSTLEFLSEFQKKVERLIESSHIFSAVDVKVLENILLRDGRFKSQFETSTSNGLLDPDYRAEVEESMFGYAEDLPPAERPIYCYFSDAEHGENTYTGKNPPPNNTFQYGPVTIELNDGVKNRATITGQDSLGSKKEYPPTPFKCPHLVSFKIFRESFDLVGSWNSASAVDRYTEAQIHGGLSALDIKAIYVSVHNGMSRDDIKTVEKTVRKYNKLHPDNKIILKEY